MDEVKSLAKEKAKLLAREAAGAAADNQELAKGLAKEATETGDEELKAKGRLKRKKGTAGVKEDLDHITKGVNLTPFSVPTAMRV